MSFASNTKEQLTHSRLREGERRALLWGVTGTIGTIMIRHGRGIGIKYTMESVHVARLAAKLAQSLYNVESEISVHENNTGINSKNLVVCLFGEGVRSLVRESRMMEAHVPFDSLSDDKLKRAYLRGAFLACGYVTDPEKGYHLELDLRTEGLSHDMLELASSMGLPMKSSTRRGHFLTYAKDGDVICDFLTLIGASESMLEFENVRAYKDTRNYANRTRNCDVANIERSAQAASAQIEAIERLIASDTELPDRLFETAQARINNRDASLQELANILGIGKSGVHHRIKALMELASTIKPTGDTEDD